MLEFQEHSELTSSVPAVHEQENIYSSEPENCYRELTNQNIYRDASQTSVYESKEVFSENYRPPGFWEWLKNLFRRKDQHHKCPTWKPKSKGRLPKGSKKSAKSKYVRVDVSDPIQFQQPAKGQPIDRVIHLGNTRTDPNAVPVVVTINTYQIPDDILITDANTGAVLLNRTNVRTARTGSVSFTVPNNVTDIRVQINQTNPSDNPTGYDISVNRNTTEIVKMKRGGLGLGWKRIGILNTSERNRRLRNGEGDNRSTDYQNQRNGWSPYVIRQLREQGRW
jgi:hypothetical protein